MARTKQRNARRAPGPRRRSGGWRLLPQSQGPASPPRLLRAAQPLLLTTALSGTARRTPGRLSRHWQWPSAGRRAPSPAWRRPRRAASSGPSATRHSHPGSPGLRQQTNPRLCAGALKDGAARMLFYGHEPDYEVAAQFLCACAHRLPARRKLLAALLPVCGFVSLALVIFPFYS